jgi:hypothetical protein
MTEYSLAPGFVRLRYTGSSIEHIQTLPVNVNGLPTISEDPTFNLKGLGTKLMSEAVDEYVDVLKGMFSNTVTINDAEFWYQPEPEDDPYWIFTHPVGVTGTAATASVPERQSVISYRSGLGHNAFHYEMEVTGDIPGSQRQNFPTTKTYVNALNTYLVGSTSFITARDGGFLIVPIWWTTKNNDALRKKILNL